MTEPKTCLSDGSPLTEDFSEIKENGQQKNYVVLCPEERAKGFVQPYRDTYIHKGKGPKYPTRELTEEEQDRYEGYGYVLREDYPESESPIAGKYWTQKQLNGGCGVETKMDSSIAETYARNPAFYGSTFCAGCGKHFPVWEFIWKGTNIQVGSYGESNDNE